MILPYDPLREAILLELNRAIGVRRAQGVSFGMLELEYGLSEETMQTILRHYDLSLEGAWPELDCGSAPTND